MGLGDTVTVVVKVVEKIEHGHRVMLDCTVTNQHGKAVIAGKAEVVAPIEKISRERIVLPEIACHEQGRGYRHLVKMTQWAPARSRFCLRVTRHACRDSRYRIGAGSRAMLQFYARTMPDAASEAGNTRMRMDGLPVW